MDYAHCPRCHNLRAIKKDGTFRKHERTDIYPRGGALTYECEGAGRSPEQAKQDVRDSLARRMQGAADSMRP